MKTIDELGKDIQEVKDKVIELEGKELTEMEMFDKWLEQLVFPGKTKDFIEEVKCSLDNTQLERRVCLYTNDYEYYIRGVQRAGGKSYLGCNVIARKARAGEDWQRGNDLPDGPFNKETWNKIVYAIVNYELVKLTPYLKPHEIPEDVA